MIKRWPIIRHVRWGINALAFVLWLGAIFGSCGLVAMLWPKDPETEWQRLDAIWNGDE